MLGGDIYGAPGGVDTAIDVDSDEPAERVAQIVKLAEQSCFALQSMIHTTEVSTSATLKGQPLASG